MRILIIIFAISRLTECSNLPYRGVTVGITPDSAPVHSLYHAQNKYGEYMYGYTSDWSAKDEMKTADGVTRGGYSYIDANGILQTVQYTSDPVNGFRVIATNIPHDLPEVAYARAQHLAIYENIKAEHALIAASQRHVPAAISPIPVAGTIVVPVRVTNVLPANPVRHAVAYVPAAESQYHAQNKFGQYSYGYAGPLSAKSETKTADGITRGGYSYIDANGILQTVQYISDSANGFRVTATNLPEAPAVKLIGPKVTTTVVGPKDNNIGTAGLVVVPPSAGDIVAPPVVNTVPIRTTTYIDSTAVEQRPIVGQEDIAQNVNIAVLHATQTTDPYLHLNPNHQVPMITSNPHLGVSHPANPTYNHIPLQSNPNPPDNLPPPFVQNPIFTGPPFLQHIPHQLPINPEKISINAIPPNYEHPPLSGPQFHSSDFNSNHPQLHNSNQIIPIGTATVSDRNEILNKLPLLNDRANGFINPQSPLPHVQPHALYGIIPVSPIPEYLNEPVAPSPDSPTNYRIPFGSAEFQNADTINNGPINHQGFNQEIIQQVPVAYPATSYQQQSPQDQADYRMQIELNGASYAQSIPNDGLAATGHLALFVPDRPAGVQQVYQTPVSGNVGGGGSKDGVQVGREQQALFLRVPEQGVEQQEQQGISTHESAAPPLQPATNQEPRITGPTGYYTTNIEY
ncbi:Cuticular protein 72Ea [Carabus blaptoides fortunei]